MAIDRETLDQVMKILGPLATRIANLEARGVVQLVDDTKKLQLLQLGVLDGEDVDDVEHHQPYGFSSVPLEGAEAVVSFLDGDRERALATVVSDRRHRPTGGEPGDVLLYNHVGSKVTLHADGRVEALNEAGAKVTLLANGDIEINPAPGREVLIREEGSPNLDRLVKKSEFDGHLHPAGTLVAPGGGGPVTGATGGAPTVLGTQHLRSW